MSVYKVFIVIVNVIWVVTMSKGGGGALSWWLILFDNKSNFLLSYISKVSFLFVF
jgi:hypothetical protein